MGCKKWDTCAPEAILHAVGGKNPRMLTCTNREHGGWTSAKRVVMLFFPCVGKLTDMHGDAYRYDANVKHMNSAGVLATLRNHEYYASRVPQSVLQALKSE